MKNELAESPSVTMKSSGLYYVEIKTLQIAFF